MRASSTMCTLEKIIVKAIAGEAHVSKNGTFGGLLENPQKVKINGRNKATESFSRQVKTYVTICQFINLGCKCAGCGREIARGAEVVEKNNSNFGTLRCITMQNASTNHPSSSILHQECARGTRSHGLVLEREVRELVLSIPATEDQLFFPRDDRFRALIGDDSVFELIAERPQVVATVPAVMPAPVIAPTPPPAVAPVATPITHTLVPAVPQPAQICADCGRREGELQLHRAATIILTLMLAMAYPSLAVMMLAAAGIYFWRGN